MFVRKKKNRSGSTNVVVVDKHGGKFKELHIIGIGHDVAEIETLCAEGQKWIKKHIGMLELDFQGPTIKEQEVKADETVLNNIDSIVLNGVSLYWTKFMIQ